MSYDKLRETFNNSKKIFKRECREELPASLYSLRFVDRGDYMDAYVTYLLTGEETFWKTFSMWSI